MVLHGGIGITLVILCAWRDTSAGLGENINKLSVADLCTGTINHNPTIRAFENVEKQQRCLEIRVRTTT